MRVLIERLVECALAGQNVDQSTFILQSHPRRHFGISDVAVDQNRFFKVIPSQGNS